MDPLTQVLLTIQALCQLGTKALDFAMTPSGQKIVENAIKDKAAFDSAMDGLKHNIEAGWKQITGAK